MRKLLGFCLLFLSTSAFAQGLIECEIQDNSKAKKTQNIRVERSPTNSSNSTINPVPANPVAPITPVQTLTVTTMKSLQSNNREKIPLQNSKYAVQVARYVGQVQIILLDDRKQENLIISATSETNFSELSLFSLNPNVHVNCWPKEEKAKPRELDDKVEVKK